LFCPQGGKTKNKINLQANFSFPIFNLVFVLPPWGQNKKLIKYSVGIFALFFATFIFSIPQGSFKK